LYATGDEYLPVVSKWFVSEPGVFPEVSKNGLSMVNSWSDSDFEKSNKLFKFARRALMSIE